MSTTTFSYTAYTATGDSRKGVLDAASRKEAIADLEGRGYVVAQCEKQWAFFANIVEYVRGVLSVGLMVQLVFFRSFALMMANGVNIQRALAISIERCENERYRETLRAVLRDVEQGMELHLAMQKHPREFTDLHVAIIRAGDMAGALPGVLERIAAFLERDNAIRKEIIKASIYPLAVMLISSGVIAFMLMTVVPKFEQTFESMHQALPLPTRIVIEISHALMNPLNWVIGILVLLGLVIAARRGLRNPKVALAKDFLIAKTPGIGKLVQKIVVSRVARLLGTLLASGVDMSEALRVMVPIAGALRYRRAIEEIKDSTSAGVALWEAIRQTHAFDPLLSTLVSVGEETGHVPAMLDKVAEFFDMEVDTALQMLLKAMEPLLIGLVAGGIGGIVISLYLPYFSMILHYSQGG